MGQSLRDPGGHRDRRPRLRDGHPRAHRPRPPVWVHEGRRSPSWPAFLPGGPHWHPSHHFGSPARSTDGSLRPGRGAEYSVGCFGGDDTGGCRFPTSRQIAV